MEGPEANNECRKIAIYCLWGWLKFSLLCYCISSLSLISIDNTVAAVDFAIVLLMIVGIILFYWRDMLSSSIHVSS